MLQIDPGVRAALLVLGDAVQEEAARDAVQKEAAHDAVQKDAAQPLLPVQPVHGTRRGSGTLFDVGLGLALLLYAWWSATRAVRGDRDGGTGTGTGAGCIGMVPRSAADVMQQRLSAVFDTTRVYLAAYDQTLLFAVWCSMVSKQLIIYIYIHHRSPFLAPTSAFEMYFAPNTDRCWKKNTSRIQKIQISPTFDL